MKQIYNFLNQIKNYLKTRVNIIINGKGLDTKIRNKTKNTISHFLFNTVLEVLARANKQGK